MERITTKDDKVENKYEKEREKVRERNRAYYRERQKRKAEIKALQERQERNCLSGFDLGDVRVKEFFGVR